jgi:hypothetical protein
VVSDEGSQVVEGGGRGLEVAQQVAVAGEWAGFAGRPGEFGVVVVVLFILVFVEFAEILARYVEHQPSEHLEGSKGECVIIAKSTYFTCHIMAAENSFVMPLNPPQISFLLMISYIQVNLVRLY